MRVLTARTGVDVVAHRLFGPLPRTTTYFCIWEFHVGRIMGRMTALEARIFMAAARQFGFTFSDPLNAPAAEYDVPSDPDGIGFHLPCYCHGIDKTFQSPS